MERVEQARETQSSAGITTGFSDLDILISGWQAGDLIVVAGAPSSGKSSLLTGFVLTCAMPPLQAPVGVAVLDTTREQYMARLLCYEGRIDSARVSRGDIREDELHSVATAAGLLNTAPVYVVDGVFSLDEITLYSRQMHQERRLRLLVLDSLHAVQVSSLPPDASRDQEVGTVVRALKALAIELGVPVIVTANLSRDINSRPGHYPELSDLRDSGEIENFADVVLLLHRPEYWYGTTEKEGNSLEGYAEIFLAKNRHGPDQVRIPVHFAREFGRFTARGAPGPGTDQ
jgi:replicative DNA helicase